MYSGTPNSEKGIETDPKKSEKGIETDAKKFKD